MKKFMRLIILVLSLGIVTACSSKIEVPDLVNVYVDDAKTVLLNNNLVPSVEYEYSDTIEKENVIRTNPSYGKSVDNNTKVVIYVSKGPEYIDAKNASIDWYLIGSGEDYWEFYKPYIKDEILYINCQPTFAVSMEWKGDGFGIASESSTYDNQIPITVTYDNKTNDANEKQEILIKIPLGSFNSEKPNNIYTKLYTIVAGKEKEIKVNFTIEW